MINWSRQPQYPVQVNRYQALSRGLVTALDPAIAPLVNGKFPTSNGGVRGVGTSGQALKYSATKTTWAFDGALNNCVINPTGFSVFLLVDVNALTNFGGLISIQDTTTTRTAIEFRLGNTSTDSKIWFARANAGAVLTVWDTGSNRVAAGAKAVIIGLTLANDQVDTQPIAYVNGVQLPMTQTSGAGQTGTVAAPTTNGLVIGGRSPDTATQLDGSIYAVRFWNRPLSAIEASQITANMWQIYAQPTRPKIGFSAGIAFDAASNSGDVAAASSYSGSASWSGINRMLSVDVSMLGAGVTVSSMTYGGATCTFIGAQSTVTSFGRVESWRICSSDSGAPAAGANTLAVTLSGSLEFTVEWASYTGVNQSVPVEGFNSAQATNVGSSTDASVSITSVADNCWIHGAVVANDTSITANQTTRNNISGTLGSGANEDNNAAKTPAGAVTMSYSGMGITTTWAIAGYAIRPLAASSGTTYTISPTGGITFSGAAVKIKGKVVIPTGGVSFAGTGSATFAHGGTTYTITPAGGITFAGVGTQVKGKVILPTGGISFSGTGARVEGKVILPVGGIVFGGTGSMSSNTQTGPTQTGERTKVGIGT